MIGDKPFCGVGQGLTWLQATGSFLAMWEMLDILLENDAKVCRLGTNRNGSRARWGRTGGRSLARLLPVILLHTRSPAGETDQYMHSEYQTRQG